MKKFVLLLFVSIAPSLFAQDVDLAITKSNSPDPVTVGDTIAYTIAITNLSASAASNVVVTDTLPSGLTVTSCVSASGAGSCSGDNAARTIAYPSLNVDEADTITIEATVNCDVPNNTVLSNSATITATENDPNAGNNTGLSTTTVINSAPVPTCPSNDIVSTDPGLCEAVISYTTSAPVDDCGTPTLDCLPASGSSLAVGDQPVTCTATDDAGQTAQCVFTITIDDTEPPTLSCPADVTHGTDAGQCTATVSYTVPSATDNCPGATVDCVPATGSIFNLGPTLVTCTATDAASNTGTCAFTVTVADTEPPTLTCPADVNQNVDPGQCTATVSYTVPSATDNCPGSTVDCVPASGSIFNLGPTLVTCTATDAASNTGTCAFTVTVTDTEPPTLSCPDDVTQGTDAGQNTAVVNYTVSTGSDNCPGTSVGCTPDTGTAFPIGTTVVTCTATDAAANTATCMFSVTVTDDEAPTIDCPSDFSQSTDAGVCETTVNYTVPTAQDNDGATVACAPNTGTLFPVGPTLVTCTATDNASNTSTCTFTVTVTDDEAPEFSCPENIVADNDSDECGAVVSFTDPTATDNCDASVTVACNPPTGSTFAVGDTVVTCSATDTAGNTSSCAFTVTVNDTQAPVITCPGNIVQETDENLCSAVVTFDPSGTDNCPNATVACDPPSGSSFDLGQTTVNCTVTDNSGNTDTCSFSVTVADSQAPTITCPFDIQQVAEPDATTAVVVYPDPVVTDNCNVAEVVCVPASGDAFPLGTTTVTCTATDDASHTSSCSFEVTVEGNFSGVQVLDPNGGEEIASGSTYTVSWGATPAISLFDLYYSLDDGTTWIRFAENVVNQGPVNTADWDVPVPKNNKRQSLLRVVGKTTNGEILNEDVSDAPFTVEVIKVLSPDGGETIVSGSIHTIDWRTNATSKPVGKVKLLASFDGGNTWQLIANVRRNRGRFNWIVPAFQKPKLECLIQVVLLSEENFKRIGTDSSDETFSILNEADLPD
jgi:uncharacterized repeat protein (TIGR01451 family)